jgi:hypothetical protein
LSANLSPPSPEQLAEVRRLGERATKEFGSCRDLLTNLLNRTILARDHPGLRVHYLGGSRAQVVLGGAGTPLDPLPLRDGRYLRVMASLFVGRDGWTRVSQPSFQYQHTSDPGLSDDWIFRYDYLRDPVAADRHPQSDLQVNGRLTHDDVLPAHRPLGRIHFPTRRMPLEGVIRLLVEQFDVPTAEPTEFWRPLLAQTERAFFEIAHDPPLGPVG